MWSEQLTNRWETRLLFLENEGKHSRTYKSDLEYCLLVSKKVLQEILKTQPRGAKLDHSMDTDQHSTIDARQFQALLAQNSKLLNELKQLKQHRDLSSSKALILKQIAEESLRKEQQDAEEQEETISELKFSLDRKQSAINNITRGVSELDEALRRLKGEQTLTLPPTAAGLHFHNQMETVKWKLSQASKSLQQAEAQTTALEEYYSRLASDTEKYRMLSKNPIVRNRKLGLSASPDLSLVLNSPSDDSDSSAEVVFPDKFHAETVRKPALPKLDFSKLRNKPAVDFSPVKPAKNRARIEEKEHQCSELTTNTQGLRERVVQLEQANEGLVQRLHCTVIPKTDRGHVVRKKVYRALSSAIDYVWAKAQPAEDLNLDESQMWCVFGSGDNNFGEEPDSVLVDCLNDIQS